MKFSWIHCIEAASGLPRSRIDKVTTQFDSHRPLRISATPAILSLVQGPTIGVAPVCFHKELRTAREIVVATPKDVVFGQLRNSGRLLEMLAADLSDKEYFTPAVEGTNHAGWILGHVAYSEDWAVSNATGAPQRIPEATRDLFKGGSKCRADASVYPSRKEIDELFHTTREHTLAALQSYDEGKWDDPAPDGVPAELFPTVGSLWGMIGFHPFWHIGQLTTVRHVLGKKLVLS